MVNVYIDFETRSYCNLKKAGAYVYAEDKSTEIMCLSYAINDGPMRLWHNQLGSFQCDDDPLDLFEAIDRGALVHAHNAGFERQIWKSCSPYSWPPIADRQFRCIAAQCAAHNLPRALEGAGQALNLPIQKDAEGHRIMLKLSKPRKPSKLNKARYFEGDGDLVKLFDYCKQDSEVSRMIQGRLPPLSDAEQALFFEDWAINDRGFLLDNTFITKALKLIYDSAHDLNAELAALTGQCVTSATQRTKIKTWCQEHGVSLLDTTGAYLDTVIDEYEPGPVRRVIEICRDVNRTSTAKYNSMQERQSRDGRVRGALLFHGAGTGRWAGRGVQPHNFPRGTVVDMDTTCDTIIHSSYQELQASYPSILSLLSGTLRGAIIAKPGHDLLVADYAAIEARVTLWYGGDEHGLNVFREGKDIYKYQAANIYHTTYDQVTKEHRFLGKQSILGLGFGMGRLKFRETCAKYGVNISEEFSKNVVEVYRDTYTGTVDFWYDCHNCAESAIRNPGQVFTTKNHRIRYMVTPNRSFLYCKLPSGRRLAYCRPHFTPGKHLWTKEPRDELAYWGVDPFNRQWVETKTYGGKLVENIVQATARDIMATAIMNLRSLDMYKVILSVHDELISEVPEGKGSLEDYCAIVAWCPAWADGLPIIAEGWRGKRYKK